MKTRVSALTAAAVQLVAGAPCEDSRGLDIPELLAFLKQNKYPFLSLNVSSTWEEFWESPEFKSARESEGNLFSSLRAEYVSIRNRWAQAGIDCILIKGGGSTPSFPYTSDNLDLLIEEEHCETACAILKELGYLELKTLEEPKKFLFRKLKGGEHVATIHLHTQVAWLVGFMDDVSLWKRTQLAPDDEVVTLPSPEDVMLITVAHSFYENKEFRLADIVKIRECWRGAKIDWEYLERVAEGQGWLDGLHFCLLVCAHLEKTLWGETSVPLPILRDWEASLKRLPLTFRYYQQITRRSSVSLPFTISFLFSKFLYYKKILHNRHCSPVRRLWDVIRTLVYGVKLKANIRPQPSLLVSFSGPDGSGKTCHAQTLRSSLYWCGLKSNYYWSRTGTSWLIRFSSASVKALIGSKLKGNEQKLGVAGRKERLRNPLLRFCWCYLTAADMVWSHLLRVRLPLLLGKIVVCDRYVFDAAAEMECTLSPKDKLTRLAIKLMLALAPKPDAGYLFDVPDEVSAQRKVEDTDADYLRQQRKAYAQLAARYHLRVKRTDGDFSTITDEITREILLSYFDHFETFLNGLFLSNPKQLNKRKW